MVGVETISKEHEVKYPNTFSQCQNPRNGMKTPEGGRWRMRMIKLIMLEDPVDRRDGQLPPNGGN